MKLISTSLFAVLMAAPAFAGSFVSPPVENTVVAPPASSVAGHFGAYYGAVSDEYNDANYPLDEYTLYGVEGSIGSAANGGFGWQVDAGFEMATYDRGRGAQDYYTTYRATVHGNFDIAGMALGAFVGFGSFDDDYNGVSGNNYWYGVEGAKSFGNFALAAQVGFGNSDNSAFEHDYSNELFGAVEGRLFVGDGIMLTANVGAANGIVDGETLTLVHYGIDGSIRLGRSNFYANAGYEFSDYTTSGTEGEGNEGTLTVGISLLFGGGLRDAYGATPMISGYHANMVGLKTETYY